MMKLAVLFGFLGTTSGLLLPTLALPRTNSATRHSPLLMQEDEPTKGISGALGGGKTTADVEAGKNPIAEAGSLAAFCLVLAGITFGALNPDVVEDFAKSNAKCVEGTIVRGEKIRCEQVNGISTRVR